MSGKGFGISGARAKAAALLAEQEAKQQSEQVTSKVNSDADMYIGGGGTAIGTAIGAYFGNPQLGAMIGGKAGGVLAKVVTNRGDEAAKDLLGMDFSKLMPGGDKAEAGEEAEEDILKKINRRV